MNTTDITTIRANAIAFMTTEQAATYLAECKAWDAANEELAAKHYETVTITTPSRKLFAPATETTYQVETVTVADLKEGDKIVYTGKNGNQWITTLTEGAFNRTGEKNLFGTESIWSIVAGGSRSLHSASEAFTRVVR